MNRRDALFLAAPTLLAAMARAPAAQGAPYHHPQMDGPPLNIAMLIYPAMFTIDLIGPQTFLQRLGNVNLFHVAKTREPVRSDLDIPFMARHDYASCPMDIDILFVPGGLKGTIPMMGDVATLDFLADRGAREACDERLHRLAPARRGGAAQRLQGRGLLDGARSSAAVRRGACEAARRRRSQPRHRRRRDGGIRFRPDDCRRAAR
jgi:hypothetical protein